MKDGRVIVDAHLTRIGVFPYMTATGSVRRELRLPEDVFARDSLDSFVSIPVTNDHPPNGLLDASNMMAHAKGWSGEKVTQDDDHVRATLTIADSETIDDLKRGKVQVSNGYSCDLEMSSGVHPKFGKYDAIQRNIRGNHIAIVDSGRAGPSARIRMDGAAMVGDDDREMSNRWTADQESRQHMTHNPDHEDVMADKDETISALNAQLKDQTKRVDSLSGELETATKCADTAEGKLEAANKEVESLKVQLGSRTDAVESESVKREKDRADKLQVVVDGHEKRFDAAVRDRSSLETKAGAILGSKFRCDMLADRAIRVAVIKKLDSKADVTDAVSDAKITGMFEYLSDQHMDNAQRLADIGDTMAKNAAAGPEKTAVEKQREDQRQRGLKPLPSTLRFKSGRAS